MKPKNEKQDVISVMKKVNLKYNEDGSLRPLPERKFIKDMTDKEISDEKLYSSRYQEKTLIDILKVNKAILLWIQIFGFSILVCAVLYVVFLLVN